VFDKLLDLVLAAKSGALSGAILVAGTLVTVTAGGGVTTITIDHPGTPPALERPAESGPEPDGDAADPAEEPEDEPEDDEDDEDGDEPVALKPERACEVSDDARTQARERVASALVQMRATIDELRGAHRSEKAAKALEQAEEMLRELADKADRALVEMCGDVQAVGDRAVAAMETVVSLARQAAAVTPSPKPTEKPKATPRPTPKPTPKPSRTPSCDDRLYATKLTLHAAFERYHALHDRMYFAHKRSSTELAKLVIANDELMHRTYDESKQRILASGCAGDMGAAIAAKAAATFERLYQSSAQAVATQSR
jgi:uncharacterized protein YfcZ (UPF0381/DUF406 family)